MIERSIGLLNYIESGIGLDAIDHIAFVRHLEALGLEGTSASGLGGVRE